MQDCGVISYNRYNPDDWTYRYSCFVAQGCHEYVPLVNEKFRPDQPDVFRDFLSCSEEQAFEAAAARVMGASELLVSVGKLFEDQVRALRWRSIVDAVIHGGWTVVRLCLEHGYRADYMFRDPVFHNINHYCVVHAVARRIIEDDVPWHRESARERLQDFFAGSLFEASAHVLTRSSNHDLQLFLWDSLYPALFIHTGGRCSLLVAFWRRRRDEFDEVCEAIGISRDNAICEVFQAGYKDVLPALLSVSDPVIRKAAFMQSWNEGDLESATAIAKTIRPEDRDFHIPSMNLAIRSCLRTAELEAIVTSLLLEKMRIAT